MYACTNLPVVNLTRATFRLAELGFFGFMMKTELTTPFSWGRFSRGGDLGRAGFLTCLRRVDWFRVPSAGKDWWKERKGEVNTGVLFLKTGDPRREDAVHGLEDIRARPRRAENILD